VALALNGEHAYV